jgi:ABC-2 type transport system permease protein
MTHTLILLDTMARRQAILMWRYAFNTLMALGTCYLFFLLAFMGARNLGAGAAGANFGDTLGGLVVGFAMWTLVTLAFNDFANTLSGEAAQGTLEQLAMSPAGLARVLLCRAWAGLGFQTAIVGLLLFVMMLTTGRWLHLDLLSILPLLALTLTGVMGLGLMLGGLTVVVKQVAAVYGVVQILFLGLIALPVDSVPGLRLVPLAWGTHLISRVMVQGESIYQMPATDLLILAANSGGYLLLGYVVFRMCESHARDRGLLGQY